MPRIRPWSLRRNRLTRLGAAALFAFTVACGGDDGVGPTSNVAPLVGDWSAVALVVTSNLDPERSVDLVDSGASFSINVQPSGQYTATLVAFGFPSTEIGTLRIEGDEIVFTREFPSNETSRAEFTISGNQVTLRGATEFDFDLNGTNQPSTLVSTLVRQ